jgi:glutamate dehydrogenase
MTLRDPSIDSRSDTPENQFLRRAMTPYFFESMRDEPRALALLSRELGSLQHNQRLVLADRPRAFVLATRSVPGSILQTLSLRPGNGRAISYAMFAHSNEPIPGAESLLEIQRYEFDCRTAAEIAAGFAAGPKVPADLRAAVEHELAKGFADFDRARLDHWLAVLWLNNPGYAKVSSPRRITQTLRLLDRCEREGGLFFDLEGLTDGSGQTRVSLSVASPPHRNYLAQILEVLNRLDLGVNRAYVLDLCTETQPYAVATFYVAPRSGEPLRPGSPLHAQLERELFNTQILAASSPEYRELVATGQVSGEDASLIRAFVAFCHTNLAHAQPDRFAWEEVRNAFHADPRMTAQLLQLFRTRFDPERKDRAAAFEADLAEAERAVRDYATGHKHLDDVRREVFRCCLALIRCTLKTNFFVLEKTAFAFRLDPAYLAALGQGFTSDLPKATPFRVTFFFSRYGFGFHVGFSDIARGGWRTVICRTDDDFLTNASTLFRECFVLAHTQHFKNKDIYEGGSKLVVLMDASALDREERNQETLRLHKLQRAVANAFLDVFVTEKGAAKSGKVVDYYREDEPIELGPDENMHDEMIEEIAALSKRRGYLLGIGVMSSKRVGINHKEYAVTSTGVVKFAEATMLELGVDLQRDPFSVKVTGGPNGDVAGNAMAILLRRSPHVQLRLILDGTAALFDPQGADHRELGRILLKEDLHAFSPGALHEGGFLLYRTGSRKEGLREQYRKVSRTGGALREEWLSLDDFSHLWGDLIFTVQADLFLPAGGRPETIDQDNWQRFLLPGGVPSARAIVEGANSFLTPAARIELQKAGVIVMRDASANKCGVISSSYEIIANLLLGEEEFLANKQRYVAGVLEILEKRAGDEANLILARRRRTGQLCTEISDSISREINEHYARLFQLFQSRPALCLEPAYQRAILAHLPAILREEPAFRSRLDRLPPKYRSAILAAEIGSSMVYRGGDDEEFEEHVRRHVERNFRG